MPRCTVGGIAVVVFDRVADVVGEYGDTVHLIHVFFESTALYWEGGVAGSPAFAVYEYRGVDFFKFGNYFIHGFDVVDCH